MPEVGGITTDEDCVVDERPVMQAWHRAALCPAPSADVVDGAVGRRLLALTGRMSIFRGSVATDPELHRRRSRTTISTTGGSAGSSC